MPAKPAKPPTGNPLESSIWIHPPRRRGEQPSLGREPIVRAAVELLDAEGLDGLSMRRLGSRLGAGATSLYWHVPNKAGLLDLVIDEVMGEVEVPDADAAGWRSAARAYATGMRTVILRHPWVTELLGARPNLGPNSMQLAERATKLLLVAGFDGHGLYHASQLLTSHAIGCAVLESSWRSAAARSGMSAQELVAEIQPYLSRIAADYPNVQKWQRENPDLDIDKLYAESFDFGVDRLLEGLAGWLDKPSP